NLDRLVRQPLGRLPEVPQPLQTLRAAAPAPTAAQPLCAPEPLRAPLRAATAISTAQTPSAGTPLDLWDSSGVGRLFSEEWCLTPFSRGDHHEHCDRRAAGALSERCPVPR